MGIIILKDKPTEKEIKTALEDHKTYIKITIDIQQKLVAIGGEYHADSEQLLINQHGSLRQHIWGGGLNIKTGFFETNAMVNLRPTYNMSMEIINQKDRDSFLNLAKLYLKNVKIK